MAPAQLTMIGLIKSPPDRSRAPVISPPLLSNSTISSSRYRAPSSAALLRKPRNTALGSTDPSTWAKLPPTIPSRRRPGKRTRISSLASQLTSQPS